MQLQEALRANRSWKEQYERFTKDSESTIEKLKEERRQNREKIERLTAELQRQSGSKLHTLELQNETMHGKLNYLSSKFDEVQAECDELRRKNERLGREIREYRQEAEMQRHQVKNLHS